MGYNHKESNVRTKLQGYVDDLTVLTQTPKQHQKVLDVLSGFLEWSGMEAKPSKCKSFAQKVFEKNSKNTKFKATTPKSFSAYDPQLKISGKPISFLQDDPVKKSIKMLGKWIDGKNRKKEDKTLVKEKLEDYLTKTNDVALTGVQKSWIYANMIIPCLTWELTIYELPASFVDTLDSLITRYLKKWLGVAICADPNILYRSREHFGLQLPNIKTCFKKAQTGVEHKMKHSKDQNIKSLHNAKSKCDLKKVRWTGNKQLEKVERAIVLDKMAFAGQNNREGLGYRRKVKMAPKEEIAKKIEELDEDERIQHAVQLGMQGSWTKWDSIMASDMKWQSLLYSYSPALLKFALNATQLTLPTPDNLVRWGKTKMGKCELCKWNSCTLMHVLSGCKVSLNEGRYTWRHDSILKILVSEISKHMNNVNAKPSKIGSRQDDIKFVKAGEKKKKCNRKKKSLLDGAADWEMFHDLGDKMVFPMYITVTPLRPDMVIVSKSLRTVIMVELTSPVEENTVKRNKDKRKKYEDLVFDCQSNKWKTHLICIEVGARGFLAESVNYMISRLAITPTIAKPMKKKISLLALRCSYNIYLQRKSRKFTKWDLS